MFREPSFLFRFLPGVIGAVVLFSSSQKTAGPVGDTLVKRTIAQAHVDSSEEPPEAADETPAHKAKKIKPKLPETKPAVCDIGYLDSFNRDLKHGVCLGDYLTNPDTECWTFKPANLVTGGVSAIGYGAMAGPAGWLIGGAITLGGAVETADNYGDKKGDSEANATRNGTKFIKGAWRCNDPAFRYMTIKADVKETDASKEADEDEAVTKSKLCDPVYSINRKIFDFLNLQNHDRNQFLCGEDKKLRDYYWKLTEEYREYIQLRLSTMTALRCYDDGGGFAFTLLNNKTKKKTHFHVELTTEGHYKGFYSWFKNPKDDPDYESWQAWLKSVGEIKAYNAFEDEKALAPGRAHFRFTDGPDGTVKLNSVGYLDHTGPLKMGYAVRYAPAEQFLNKRPLAPLRPFLVDVDKMRDDYMFFSVWADKAKSCCSEQDPAKKSECLNKWPRSDSN